MSVNVFWPPGARSLPGLACASFVPWALEPARISQFHARLAVTFAILEYGDDLYGKIVLLGLVDVNAYLVGV